MRIVRLQSEAFKRITAVDITPDGDLIEVRGENGNGKSSVLDSILAALGGAAEAPEMPVRQGEEAAVIRLDLGELIVTRYFTAAGTTSLKVTTPDGAAYGSAQTMLDKLVGHISFDPLKFRDLKPEEQAEELRRLVDIVDPDTGELLDLAAIEAANAEDYAKRRDVNRDGVSLKGRIDALGGVRFVPEDAPDKAAIEAHLASAGETNAALERERQGRSVIANERSSAIARAEEQEGRARVLRAQADEADREAEAHRIAAAELEAAIEKWEPLADPVDTAALIEELAEADNVEGNRRHNAERDRLKAEMETLREQSVRLTKAMADRNAKRAKAIAAAKMPVEGLELIANEEGKLAVHFGGVPFSQASDAERMRTSVAVAMAANPELRVIRLKDASLLDKKAIEILREMATANDFQVWAEFVGDEGPGIIMEAGEVRGADKPEPLPKPRGRKVETAGDNLEAGDVVKIEDGAARKVEGAVPRETGGTLFERMSREQGKADAPKLRPQAITEFVTKPKGQ